MADHRRDALLASVALSALLGGLLATGRAAALGSPAAVLGGVAGALALEVVFLRADRPAAAWDRPVVWGPATVATVGCGAVGLWVGGAVVAAALVWGLVAYLLLLAAVVVGGRNPVAVALGEP